MKDLIITRLYKNAKATTGTYELFDEAGNSLCAGFTLEPAGEPSIQPGCNKPIPTGTYSVCWHYSQHFHSSLLPHLFNADVAKGRMILIHTGNTSKDTQGCVLLGTELSEAKDEVRNSTVAFNKLMSFFNTKQALDEQVRLIIQGV